VAEKFTDVPMLTDRFDRALVLASAHHRRQLRKGTDVPYMAHLLAVAASSLELGGDEDTAIGALLHDAVEDGGGPPMLERIRDEFGDAVAAIVAANSDTDVEPKPPWRARKEAYVAGMAEKSAAALLVSLADKLHNARSIVTDLERVGDAVWERFSATADEVRWYYDALAAGFAGRADELGPVAGAGIRELQRLVVSMGGSQGAPELADARRPRLYLSQEPGLDLLSAVEFGRVDDAQPAERWIGVGAGGKVGLLHQAPGGRCVGFVVTDASAYDPDDPVNAELWERPRFDVPALGLTDVPPNAVIVATWALYGRGVRTVNRELFSDAINADGEQALECWLLCLQAGDSMAHYALGYTLLELGRLPEAYRHLRHYTEIAPGSAWSWCFYGRAAAAVGESESARVAFETAVAMDADGETDARELLDAFDEGRDLDLSGDEEDDAVDTDGAGEAADLAETGWQAAVLGLAAAFPYGNELRLDEAEALLLLNVEPVPVLLEVQGATGATWVRAMVGTVPGLEPDDQEPMSEYLEELPAGGADILFDGDENWMLKSLPVPIDALDTETLVLVVRGIAASAAENTDTIDDVGLSLIAPRTFDETLDGS